MESGGRMRRAAMAITTLLLLQLMAAPPMAMVMAARTLPPPQEEGTTPVIYLNTIAREFARSVTSFSCLETCIFVECYTGLLGCQLANEFKTAAHTYPPHTPKYKLVMHGNLFLGACLLETNHPTRRYSTASCVSAFTPDVGFG
jgi:hypothetical protein